MRNNIPILLLEDDRGVLIKIWLHELHERVKQEKAEHGEGKGDRFIFCSTFHFLSRVSLVF